MEKLTRKEIKSFQQQLSLVEFTKGDPVYIKKIVSNYSWWTFEQADVLHRELTSYRLLAPFNLVPNLLNVDQVNKQFTVEAIKTTVKPEKELVYSFLDSLISLLIKLKSITGQELQSCSFADLLSQYLKNGQAAQVKPQLLDELEVIVARWIQHETQPLSYVHGDLHFGNLLYDGKSVKLIDFEEAILSHPIIDANSLSWDVMDCFGQEMYEYFRRSYREVFQTEIIKLEEWKRFCKLRDWIVGRYLETCCSPEVRAQAHKFIVNTEPASTI